jgi:predicted RNA binding protein YcfA (HicA-like mRNA interferase family)
MDKFLPKDVVTVSKGTKPQKIKAKKGKMIKVTRSEGFVEVTTNDLDLIKQLKKDGFV